jgi:hypothetical protein
MKEKHMIAILLVTLLGSADVLAAEGKPDPTHEAFKTTFALMELYSYQPFQPSSAMPDHLWMNAGNGRVFFLHFNKPVTDPTAHVIFAGDGIKGRFCREDQPESGETGFVHFHRLATPQMEISHGSKAGEGGGVLILAVRGGRSTGLSGDRGRGRLGPASAGQGGSETTRKETLSRRGTWTRALDFGGVTP